jgi:hypothetical protein
MNKSGEHFVEKAELDGNGVAQDFESSDDFSTPLLVGYQND